MPILTTDQLQAHIDAGNSVKYVFFWGHQPPKQGVSKTCFSQWYPSPFEIDGVLYQTAEHYMMASKARVFGDAEAEQAAIAATHPNAAKKIGRRVRNFDNATWEQHRFQIVVDGNMAKFAQNANMRDFLLGTGDRVIVEASPVDRIWGIGLAADDPRATNPDQWRGLNLLGFALMEVRERLARSSQIDS